MRIHITKFVLLVVLFLSIVSIGHAQTHKTYSGVYPDNRSQSWEGEATYTYYEDEMGQRIYDGNFTYNIHLLGTDKATGRYKNNVKDGKWTYTKSLGSTPRVIVTEEYKNGMLNGPFKYEERDKSNRLLKSIYATFKDNALVGNYQYKSGTDTYITGQFDEEGRKQGKWEHLYIGKDKYVFMFENDECKKSFKSDVRTGSVSQTDFSIIDEYLQKHILLDVERMGRAGTAEMTWYSKSFAVNLKPVTVAEKTESLSPKSEGEASNALTSPMSSDEVRKALNEYINKNLRYPVSAEEKGIQGRVTLLVEADLDGSPKVVEVLHGIDPSLDAEAIRLINNMPKWLLRENTREAIDGKITIPITFRLQ